MESTIGLAQDRHERPRSMVAFHLYGVQNALTRTRGRTEEEEWNIPLVRHGGPSVDARVHTLVAGIRSSRPGCIVRIDSHISCRFFGLSVDLVLTELDG